MQTVIDVVDGPSGGLLLRELAPGVTVDEVRAATGAPLQVPAEPATMASLSAAP